jgi:hypothetical protein
LRVDVQVSHDYRDVVHHPLILLPSRHALVKQKVRSTFAIVSIHKLRRSDDPGDFDVR